MVVTGSGQQLIGSFKVRFDLRMQCAEKKSTTEWTGDGVADGEVPTGQLCCTGVAGRQSMASL